MTASAQSARAEGGAGGVGRLTGGPKVDADDRVDLRGRDGGRLAGWRATRRRARGGFSQRRGVAPAGALTFCSPSSARPRASSSESVRMRSMVSKSAYSRDGAASQAGGQQGLGATAGARLKSRPCNTCSRLATKNTSWRLGKSFLAGLSVFFLSFFSLLGVDPVLLPYPSFGFLYLSFFPCWVAPHSSP